jgi:hypothetical protein
MNQENVTLVIVLAAVIVIGVNGMLYLALRRGNEANLIDLARKSFRRARNPWQDEEDELKELADLVAGLKAQGQAGPALSESEGDPANPRNTTGHD